MKALHFYKPPVAFIYKCARGGGNIASLLEKRRYDKGASKLNTNKIFKGVSGGTYGQTGFPLRI